MLHCSMERLVHPLPGDIYAAMQQRRSRMAKIASPTFPRPASTLPGLKLPKLDLDALSGVQKANLAAAHEAQRVLVEAVQAIARVQQRYLEQATAETKAALARQDRRRPEAVLAEVRVAADRTITATKEVADLAVAAQRRVAELVAQRAQASVDEVKALAA
jgi:hypothetical protein